jgi:hypothetical protein
MVILVRDANSVFDDVFVDDLIYKEYSKILRLPHYLDKRLIDGGKVVSPTRRPHSTPRFLYFLRYLVLISVRG